MITKGVRVLALGAAAVLLAACAGNHRDQPYYEAQEPSGFFPDGQSARPLVEGSVAQGQLRLDQHLYTGREANGQLARTFPFPVTRAVLERGQAQYTGHCVPCHGFTGEGDGMIVRRGYTRPPAYTEARVRDQPVGHYFDVITNGYGSMPAYADQVYLRDRWAIAAYIRALQLSQDADIRQLPPEDQQRVRNPPQPSPREGEQETEAPSEAEQQQTDPEGQEGGQE